MAISPFSRPVNQPTLQLREYRPVELIGQSINRLDAKQERGLMAADKLGALRDELSQRVLPEQQAYVDEALAGVDQELQRMAESGDYINAMPKIRKLTRDVESGLSTFNQNYEAVQARKKEIAEILKENPEDLNQADIDMFLGSPRAALEGDPDAVFQAPSIVKRINVEERLRKHFKDLEPDQEVSFVNANGIEEKVKVKDLTEEQLVQAGRSLIENNDAIRAQMARDVNYRRENMSDTDLANLIVNEKRRVQKAIDHINNNQGISDSDRKALIEEYTQELNEIDNNPEEAINNQLYLQEEEGYIEPFRQHAFKQVDRTRKVDPYLRAQIATRSAQAEEQKVQDLMAMGSLQSPRTYPKDVKLTDHIQAGNRRLEQINSQLAQGDLLPSEIQALESEAETLRMSQSVAKYLRDDIKDEFNIDEGELTRLEQKLPDPPPTIDAERAGEIIRMIKDGKAVSDFASGPAGGALGAGGRSTSREAKKAGQQTLTAAERQFAQRYQDKWGELQGRERDIINKINSEAEKRMENRGSVAAVDILTTDDMEKQLIKFASRGGAGVEIFKGTPEDGELYGDKGLDDGALPEITDVYSVSARPVDGKYRMAARVKDADGDEHDATIVTTDSESVRRWLGDTQMEGRAFNATKYGGSLGNLPNGGRMDLFDGQQNLLGDGNFVKRRGNMFEFHFPNRGDNGVVREYDINEAVRRIEEIKLGRLKEQGNE